MAEPVQIVKKQYGKEPESEFMDYGKLPPQAREIEATVLGAIMIDSNAIHEIAPILRSADMFYHTSHMLIYTAIIELFAEGYAIDALTVVERLKKNGTLEAVGGPFFVSQLTTHVFSSAHSVSHALIVKAKWVARQAIAVSTQIVKKSYDDTDDPMEAVETGITDLTNIIEEVVSQSQQTMNDLVNELDAYLHSGDDKMGLSIGIRGVDEHIMGLCPGNFIILAGRPAEGKSTLAVQAALKNARNGIPVAFFSLEMSKLELMQKLVAVEAGISVEHLRNGALTAEEWDKYRRVSAAMRKWPLHIVANGGLTWHDIMAMTTVMHRKFGIKMVIIDYLQLLELGTEGNAAKRINNREQELSSISKGAKRLAGKLNIPIVALSAVSREMEKRSGKDRRPKKSDLRESGALEQDANVIIFVFRPETNGIARYEDGESTEGITELIIAKSRMSSITTVKVRFDGKHSRFMEMEEGMATYEQKSGGFKRVEKENEANNEDDLPF